MLPFDGQVALVTGGAVRLGQALSQALAEAGATVAVHYSGSKDAALQTVERIAARGGAAAALAADFEHPAQAARDLVSAVIERYGRIDILVNSAAIFLSGTLASTTEAEWDRHFAINLKAPFFLCQEFSARRAAGRPGNIVNIADWRGIRPVIGHLAYTLTKSALVTLTQLLARELAPEIRVNAVAPGAILPPPGAGVDHMERIAREIPLARTGTVEDIASAVLYLLRSEFVTGEVLFVTGGQHLL